MADAAASAVLAPFEAGVKQAHAYRVYLEDRLAAEERYVGDLQRVLDRHNPDGDSDSKLKRSAGKKFAPPRPDGHAGRSWMAMRKAEQYEVFARQKRVEIVRREALAPLDTWCKNQERALQNLKSNLLNSVRQYAEARNKIVPDAQKAYEKRATELDELVRQEEAVKMQRQLLSERPPHLQRHHTPALSDDTSQSTTPEAHEDFDDTQSRDPAGDVRSLAGEQQRPLPKLLGALRSKEARKDGWDPSRPAGKKSNIFHRRPRSSDTPPEFTTDFSGGMEVLLRKKTKTQRETEDLDVQYRDAVNKLETLRLSVLHFLKLAQDQCLSHRAELGMELVRAWTEDEKQDKLLSEAVHMYRAKMEQEATWHRALIQKDVKMVEEAFPSLQVHPVPYHNHWHGDAKDLLFGVRLMDYASSHSRPYQPPLLVQKCIEYLDRYALGVEGLYRTSAKRTAIQALANRAEQDEVAFHLSPDRDDAATVASLLKRYLRELPDPLLPLSQENMARYIQSRNEEIQTGWPFLRQKIRSQPPVHQVTLQTILDHLTRVAENENSNKMPASNLALVLGPVIFFGALEDKNQLPNADQDRTMEDLIVYGRLIFEDLKGTGPLSPLHCPRGSGSLGPNPKQAGGSLAQGQNQGIYHAYTQSVDTNLTSTLSKNTAPEKLTHHKSIGAASRLRRSLTLHKPQLASGATTGNGADSSSLISFGKASRQATPISPTGSFSGTAFMPLNVSASGGNSGQASPLTSRSTATFQADAFSKLSPSHNAPDDWTVPLPPPEHEPLVGEEGFNVTHGAQNAVRWQRSVDSLDHGLPPIPVLQAGNPQMCPPVVTGDRTVQGSPAVPPLAPQFPQALRPNAQNLSVQQRHLARPPPKLGPTQLTTPLPRSLQPHSGTSLNPVHPPQLDHTPPLPSELAATSLPMHSQPPTAMTERTLSEEHEYDATRSPSSDGTWQGTYIAASHALLPPSPVSTGAPSQHSSSLPPTTAPLASPSVLTPPVPATSVSSDPSAVAPGLELSATVSDSSSPLLQASDNAPPPANPQISRASRS